MKWIFFGRRSESQTISNRIVCRRSDPLSALGARAHTHTLMQIAVAPLGGGERGRNVHPPRVPTTHAQRRHQSQAQPGPQNRTPPNAHKQTRTLTRVYVGNYNMKCKNHSDYFTRTHTHTRKLNTRSHTHKCTNSHTHTTVTLYPLHATVARTQPYTHQRTGLKAPAHPVMRASLCYFRKPPGGSN